MSLFEKLTTKVEEVEANSSRCGLREILEILCNNFEDELGHLAKENVVLKARLNHVEALLNV